ncbi:MAG: NAD(P)/FAD-dependent oxidoreductase [Parvibaculaceae bacterium]
MNTSVLAPNAQLDPYWWRAAPLRDRPVRDLPSKCDVAIVGSGFTGLSAALHLARAGRSVSVLEAKEPGWGASTRNFGFVGRTLKHMFGDILAHEGLDRAVRVYRETRAAYDSVFEVVESENIDCRLRRQGRLILAVTPGQRNNLLKEFGLRKTHLGEEFHVVEKADQPSEIDTERFLGGVLIPDMAGVHPGLYHQGLLAATERAGATVYAHTEVTDVRPGEGRITVKTARGPVEARNVLLATNGYSGPGVRFLNRRLVPFDAYVATTEQMPEETVARLLPGDRTFLDWNFNVDSFRRAPDDPKRIMICALTGPRIELPRMGEMLRDRLARTFPSLANVRIDNVWTGRCSGTRDLDPHWGVHEGVHYAGGYCFAGVPMGTWFGRQVARHILGEKIEHTAFLERPLPSIPFYTGNPWFVPLAIRWMARNDA